MEKVIVNTVFLRGVTAIPCTVTITKKNGFEIEGVPEVAAREIRASAFCGLVHAEHAWRGVHVLVEPFCDSAEALDYPIAAGVVSLFCDAPEIPKNAMLFGAISLTGQLRSVRGAACFAKYAEENGLEAWGPASNKAEMLAVAPSSCRLINTLNDRPELTLAETVRNTTEQGQGHEHMFSDMDIVLQTRYRRAALIAAAGSHNLLFVGRPGGGKTIAARSVASILPPMTTEEREEVILNYSAVGLLPKDLFLPGFHRPFRAPHHTASTTGLVGGWLPLRPGEVTLAHHGVLFLDELIELPSQQMSAVKLALEDGEVDVTCRKARTKMPARFLLIGATNPCFCGYFGSHLCSCSPERLTRFRSRLNQIFEPFAMIAMEESEPEHGPAISQEEARRQVVEAREILRQHLPAGRYTSAAMNAVSRIGDYPGLGASRINTICRVARTIAALAGRAVINTEDLQEAFGYSEAAAFPLSKDDQSTLSNITEMLRRAG